jgi:hypothetical protein
MQGWYIVDETADRVARNDAADAIRTLLRRQGRGWKVVQKTYARYSDILVNADMDYQLDDLALQAITVKYQVRMEVSYNIVIDQRWLIRMWSGEPALTYCRDREHSLTFLPMSSR